MCCIFVLSYPFLQLKWEFSEELKKFQEQVQHQLNQAEESWVLSELHVVIIALYAYFITRDTNVILTQLQQMVSIVKEGFC